MSSHGASPRIRHAAARHPCGGPLPRTAPGKDGGRSGVTWRVRAVSVASQPGGGTNERGDTRPADGGHNRPVCAGEGTVLGAMNASHAVLPSLPNATIGRRAEL